MKMFLWLIFVLFIAEIIYIAFFEKKKPVESKQIVRNKNGKKYYRIDYLKGSKGGLKW